MARKSKTVSLHGKDYTVEGIKEKLRTNDAWLYRGIKAIYAYQTAEEKHAHSTREDNGVGFNHVDALILSSFARQLAVRDFLTPPQIAIARKKMVKYAGQLLRIVESKSHD